MSDYSEHLISQAGGDGHPVTAAQLEDPEGRALVAAIHKRKTFLTLVDNLSEDGPDFRDVRAIKRLAHELTGDAA